MSGGRIFKSPWWVVFGSTLGLIVGNGPITLFTFGVLLKPIVAEFGWHRGTVASAITISQALGAVSTPFVGRLVDRFGVRRVTLPFIVALALTTAAISLTPTSPAVFFLLYALSGVAGAGQSPLNYAKAISAWFEARRGLALGIAMAGVGLGAALIPQLARVLIDSFGWRGAYVGLGIATFGIAFPAVALFVREPDENSLQDRRHLAAAGHLDESASKAPGIAIGEAVKSSRFWFLLIAIFFVAASVNGTIAHIVPILTDRGISTSRATSLLSASGIALIAGRVLSGHFLDRFFGPYVAACFFLLPLCGIAMLSSGAGGIAPLMGTICLGLGLGSEIGIMAFLVGRYFGLRTFGEIYGYVMGVFLFGSGLGPSIMGFCYDLMHSYNVALAGFCAALLIASVLISRLGPYSYPARRTVALPGVSPVALDID